MSMGEDKYTLGANEFLLYKRYLYIRQAGWETFVLYGKIPDSMMSCRRAAYWWHSMENIVPPGKRHVKLNTYGYYIGYVGRTRWECFSDEDSANAWAEEGD